MNFKQALNLKRLTNHLLLRLTPEQRKYFDIECPERCAWGSIYATGLFRQERDSGHDNISLVYETGLPHDGGVTKYDAPEGEAAIAEFADRVYNVMCYHASLG